MTPDGTPNPEPTPPALPHPELSVVIPVRDGAATIGAQLEALVTQDWDEPFEIVVADNGSLDATGDVVARFCSRFADLRVIDASAAPGPSHARNAGAHAARGRAVAFCDADDVVAPGWVGAMARALRDHEFVTGPLDLAALNPAWLAGSRGSAGRLAPGELEGIPFASSCNLGITRARLLEVGGFDERLAVGEDIELAFRLRRIGVRLHFSPEIELHYRLRPTLRTTFEQARAYGAAKPALLEALRARGEADPDRWSGLRNWVWLVRHVGSLGSKPGRAHWLWVAGQRLGSLEGSWRVRRLYP
jgi:glycosyltransferase involved in cell wall biosynthesis